MPPAPKPGVIPLRPLGVGEILDGAISYIRENPKVTLGLAAVLATLGQLIQVPAMAFAFGGLSQSAATPSSGLDDAARMMETTGPGLAAFGVGGLVTFVAGTVLTGMLIVVVGRAVVGQKPALGEVWAVARPRLLGLVGLSLFTGLIALGVLLVGSAPFVVSLALDGPVWLSVILGVVAFSVTVGTLVYLWVAWSLAAAAYVLEGTSVIASLRRSNRLVRPQWWRILGIQLLGAIITMILGGILSVPFSLGASVVTADGAGDGVMGVIGLSIAAIGTILGTTLTAPFSSGITGLLYFDQRIRREGLDIELAQAAQGGVGAALSTPSVPEQGGPPPSETPAQAPSSQPW